MMKRALVLTLCLCGSALAITRVPGTSTYYSASQDPITDVNTGYIAIGELYDENGDTFLGFKCADSGQSGLWGFLRSKNELLSQDDVDSSTFPTVIARLGSDAPTTIGASHLSTVTNSDGTAKQNIGLDNVTARSMVAGLLAGKKLVIRVNRISGGQPLTYTFPATGFAAAWRGVQQCR